MSTFRPVGTVRGVVSPWHGHLITLVITARFPLQFVLGLQWKLRPAIRMVSTGAFCDRALADEKVGRTAAIYSPRFITRAHIVMRVSGGIATELRIVKPFHDRVMLKGGVIDDAIDAAPSSTSNTRYNERLV